MAEPLFLLASIKISATALRRWLKSAPLFFDVFDDWPDAPASDAEQPIAGISARDASVADILVLYCIASLEIDDGYLHCRYDEQAGELHFAARYRYGDESGARVSVLLLCALLRGIAAVYTAREPSHIQVFDSGANLLRIEIQKKASHVLPDPGDVKGTDWFVEWVNQNLSDPDRLLETLHPSLVRALKKSISLGALQASPLMPYRYDFTFWTDGQHVYSWWPCNQRLEHADPRTFRRLTALNGTNAAFYADKQQVWHCRPMGSGITRVQAIEPGASMQGWLPYSYDGEPVLRCGNTVWTTADISYPGSHPGREKAPGALASVQPVIASHKGILTWEKTYRAEYLRPTQVDGRSFVQVKECLFEDAQAVYVQTDQGLMRMDDSVPGQTTRIGALYCNNGLVFIMGYKARCQPDMASLRYLSHQFYLDNRHVYFLRYDERTHDCSSDLFVLEGADPASFHVLGALPNAPISGDDQHAWLNAEMLPDVHPDAIRFFVKSNFWTDGQRVYYCKKPVSGAEPQNFEVFPNSAYAQQRGVIYFQTEAIPGADIATFVVGGYHEAHDRYRSYGYNGQLVIGSEA